MAIKMLTSPWTGRRLNGTHASLTFAAPPAISTSAIFLPFLSFHGLFFFCFVFFFDQSKLNNLSNEPKIQSDCSYFVLVPKRRGNFKYNPSLQCVFKSNIKQENL